MYGSSMVIRLASGARNSAGSMLTVGEETFGVQTCFRVMCTDTEISVVLK